MNAHECNPFVDDRGNFAKVVSPLTDFLSLLRLTSLREIMYTAVILKSIRQGRITGHIILTL